ncbi:probable WRKY transcription factor protein 1 isoform X1 [Cherax quadricarinatus]|uniref:probable WRKY transcription factor protein 1 isoform X1 n=2 Tax=Cherax quadricarinatus TaxID=27406 RepID=UPI00387E67E4
MGAPSKKCEMNFHQIHRLLTCFEEGQSIKRCDRWAVVRRVREFLNKFLTLSNSHLLKGWLKTRQEELFSVSTHFLKLIVVGTRRVKNVNIVEDTVADDIKLVYDILGGKSKAVAMVSLKAGEVITEGQGLLYICQAQVYGLIVREVVNHYLAGVNPESEDDIWWSILLYRLWLLSCEGETRKRGLLEILALLPSIVSRRRLGSGSPRVKNIATKSLFNVPMNKLVKMAPESLQLLNPDQNQPPIDCKDPEVQLELKSLNNLLKSTIHQLKTIIRATSRTGIMKYPELEESLLMRNPSGYSVWKTPLYSTLELKSCSTSMISPVLQIPSTVNQCSKDLEEASPPQKNKEVKSSAGIPQENSFDFQNKEKPPQGSFSILSNVERISEPNTDIFESNSNILESSNLCSSEDRMPKQICTSPSSLKPTAGKECKTLARNRLKVNKSHRKHERSPCSEKDDSQISCSSFSPSSVHSDCRKMKRQNALMCSRYSISGEAKNMSQNSDTSSKRLRLSSETEIEFLSGGYSLTPNTTDDVCENIKCDKEKRPMKIKKWNMTRSSVRDNMAMRAGDEHTHNECKNVQEACLKNDIVADGSSHDVNAVYVGKELSEMQSEIYENVNNEENMTSQQNERDRKRDKSTGIDNELVIYESDDMFQAADDDDEHESLADCINNSKNNEVQTGGDLSRAELNSNIVEVNLKDGSHDSINNHNIGIIVNHIEENTERNDCWQSWVNDSHNQDKIKINSSQNETKSKNKFIKNSIKTLQINKPKNLTKVNDSQKQNILHSCEYIGSEGENDSAEYTSAVSCQNGDKKFKQLVNCHGSRLDKIQSNNNDRLNSNRKNSLHLPELRERSLTVSKNVDVTKSSDTFGVQPSVACTVCECDHSYIDNNTTDVGKSSSDHLICSADILPVSSSMQELTTGKKKVNFETESDNKKNSKTPDSTSERSPLEKCNNCETDEEIKNSEGGSIQLKNKSTNRGNNSVDKCRTTKNNKKPERSNKFKVKDMQVKNTQPVPAISSSKNMTTLCGNIKGVPVEDRCHVPEGFKRIIVPRLSKTSNKLCIKTDVYVYTPDGKAHNCRKKLNNYIERKSLKLDGNADMNKIFRMSPSTKRKVMQRNTHLTQVVEANKRKLQNPGNPHCKIYLPLGVTIEKSSSALKGGTSHGDSSNEGGREINKGDKNKIYKTFKKSWNHSFSTNIKKCVRKRQKINKLKVYNVQKDELQPRGGRKNHEPSSQQGKGVGTSSIVNHKVLDPYEFSEENSANAGIGCKMLSLTHTRTVTDATQKNIECNEQNSAFDDSSLCNEFSSTELADVESFPVEKNINLQNASSISASTNAVDGISSGNSNGKNSQPSVSDENLYDGIQDACQIRHNNLCKLSLSDLQDKADLKLNCIDSGSGAQSQEGYKGGLVMTSPNQTYMLGLSEKKNQRKEQFTYCEEHGVMTSDGNESLGISDDSSYTTACSTEYNTYTCKNISKNGDKTTQQHKYNQEKVLDSVHESLHDKEIENSANKQNHASETSVNSKSVHKDNVVSVNMKSLDKSDTHTPSFSTFRSSGRRNKAEDLNTPQNQTIHQQSCDTSSRFMYASNKETQTSISDLKESRARRKEDDKKTALIPLPAALNTENTLLELRCFKLFPHHPNNSYLINSQFFTISPHETDLLTVDGSVLSTRPYLGNLDSLLKHNRKKQSKKCFKKYVGRTVCRKNLLKAFNNQACVEEQHGSTCRQIEKACDGYNSQSVSPANLHSGDHNTGKNLRGCSAKHLHPRTQNSNGIHCLETLEISEACSNESNNEGHSLNFLEHMNETYVSGNVSSQISRVSKMKIMKPHARSYKLASSCFGSHLCYLRANLRLSSRGVDDIVQETGNSSLCQYHYYHSVKPTAVSLLSLTLLEMSCPLCRLVFYDLSPCCYQPDVLGNPGINHVDRDSPLETLVEKLEVEYW